MGAELTSVLDRASGYEFIWQGDPNYWGRQGTHSLPIVGSLKEGTVSSGTGIIAYHVMVLPETLFPGYCLSRSKRSPLNWHQMMRPKPCILLTLFCKSPICLAHAWLFLIRSIILMLARYYTITLGVIQLLMSAKMIRTSLMGHNFSFQPQQMLRHIPLDLAAA